MEEIAAFKLRLFLELTESMLLIPIPATSVWQLNIAEMFVVRN